MSPPNGHGMADEPIKPANKETPGTTLNINPAGRDKRRFLPFFSG